jgi:hypothetical protein
MSSVVCVNRVERVAAETKDHFNWELIGKCAQELPAEQGNILKMAFDAVEDEEEGASPAGLRCPRGTPTRPARSTRPATR